MKFKVERTDDEWKKILTPQQYKVLRKKGTDLPFVGRCLSNKEKGVYKCAGCDNRLFSTEAEFNSGTGWPSFWKPYSKKSVLIVKHRGPLGEEEVEVICARCGSHLGHLFHDAPQTPTGDRYCTNCSDFNFAPAKKVKKK